MPNEAPSIIFLALSDGVPRTAFIAAIIVGSILNIINQGDALFGSGSVDMAKLLPTFCVPYFVSTYGSVAMKLRMISSTLT